MITYDQKMKAVETVKVLIDKANNIYKKSFPVPNLGFNLRGRCAGYAEYTNWSISLNPHLMANNFDKFVSGTIPHEVCHLITYGLYGRGIVRGKTMRHHGYEWKSVMIRMGYNPSRCHNYDTLSVDHGGWDRPFVYKCGCRKHYLTATLHRRIRDGQIRFCKRCKGKVDFVEIETVEMRAAQKKEVEVTG